MSTSLRSFVGNVSWIFAFGAAVPVHAQDQSFWAFIEPGRVVTRCAESSPAHEQARAKLEDFDHRINRLEKTAPPAAALEELHALLKSECFLSAAETRRVPKPDSSESLKQWWLDGGRAWLESYLELPEFGLVSDLVPHIAVPPDPRKTLNLDSHRDHLLQSFLCGLRDTSCGAATRGWKLRADKYFESHRAMHRDDASIAIDEQPASGPGRDVPRMRGEGSEQRRGPALSSVADLHREPAAEESRLAAWRLQSAGNRVDRRLRAPRPLRLL